MLYRYRVSSVSPLINISDVVIRLDGKLSLGRWKKSAVASGGATSGAVTARAAGMTSSSLQSEIRTVSRDVGLLRQIKIHFLRLKKNNFPRADFRNSAFFPRNAANQADLVTYSHGF